MMATLESPASPASQGSAVPLTKPQKLAVLLVMLGTDAAGDVLKGLGPTEVESVTAEMTRLELVNQEQQLEVLREFSGVALAAVTGLQGGVGFARTALEKGLGTVQASTVLKRLGSAEPPPASTRVFSELEPDQLWHILRYEQPQTVALVLSFLPPDRGAQVLARLPEDRREQVVERLATLEPTSSEVLERVVHWLQTRVGAQLHLSLNQPDGMGKAAALLNTLEKSASHALLETLDSRNPDLCKTIKQRMFTFHDLGTLDATTLQRVLREVDLRELAVSLKNAGEELRSLLLGCISRRAAETVREEISLMGPIRLREVEGAQSRVIETVRRLEAEGEIELSPAGANRNDLV